MMRRINKKRCFFFKQKTAYEMRISDWSSDVCSSDLLYLRQRFGCDRVVAQVKGECGTRRIDRNAHRGQCLVVVAVLMNEDRKSVVYGKSVSVRVDLVVRRIIKTKIFLILFPSYLYFLLPFSLFSVFFLIYFFS